MADNTSHDRIKATPEQVCMLGLYAVGATLLSSLQQTTSTSSTPTRGNLASPTHSSMLASRDQQDTSSLKFLAAKTGVRGSKSLDLLSESLPLPPHRREPMMDRFHHHTHELGIMGDALPFEMPPSPRSHRANLLLPMDGVKAPRFQGWLKNLQPSRPIFTGTERKLPRSDHVHETKQRTRAASRPSFSLPVLREMRVASAAEANASSPYVPARLGQIPFLPQPRKETGEQPPRSRSMSLDLPRRLARKSITTKRFKKTPSPAAQAKTNGPPQLDRLPFSCGDDDDESGRCNCDGIQSNLSKVSLRDLPRESTSSSGVSDYDYHYDHARRHSISGSSGHEGCHPRGRGLSNGSATSTAPSTAPDPCAASVFLVSDAQEESDSDHNEDSDYEDDIEWERPPSPRTLRCPAGASQGRDLSAPQQNPCVSTADNFAYNDDRMVVPSMLSCNVQQKEPRTPKKRLSTSMLRLPRRIASSSSLGDSSKESGRTSFSKRARCSFSQARTTMLTTTTTSSPQKPRRSAAADTGSTSRPAAVYLQPIHSGIISRPCQTTSNPPPSVHANSNSSSGSRSGSHVSGRTSIRFPSFYVASSSEGDSVNGGSSSSGRTWESTAPELAALEELVLTECKYLSDLQLLLDVYIEGLRRMALMTPASLDRIVSNLEEVMAFSKFLIDCIRSFLPRRLSPPTSISSQPSNENHHQHPSRDWKDRVHLEDHVTEPDYLGLSTKLVNELPARMQVYARYCLGHQAAKERLDFESQLRPAVATFIELTRSTNPTLQGMDIAQFLVLPVQRITRYPLLFGSLEKECGKRLVGSDELREEDEDSEFDNTINGDTTAASGAQQGACGGYGTIMEQRHERARATYDNWIRLRNVSTSICEITNLAISYQQQEQRPLHADQGVQPPRLRNSLSSPMLFSSGAQANSGARLSPFAPAPPPPALVSNDPLPAAACGSSGAEGTATRNNGFTFASWRKTFSVNKSNNEKQVASTSSSRINASAATVGAMTASSSSSSSSSSGSSTSLFARVRRSFRRSA